MKPLRIPRSDTIELDDGAYTLDYGAAIDISLHPTPRGPTAFGAAPLLEKPIIEVARGARCNCYAYAEFTPHLHGTHIETRSHIAADPRPVVECLTDFRFLARLITVSPVSAKGLGLSLVGHDDDLIITRAAIERALSADSRVPEALIVRTPTFPDKPIKNYTGTNPPYPHHGVAQLCLERGIQHIVLDLPSADREEGELFFHRTFWNDPRGADGAMIPELAHLSGAPRSDATITELAFIPDTVVDGWYALFLVPLAFPGDAAPVRPLIAPLRPAKLS